MKWRLTSPTGATHERDTSKSGVSSEAVKTDDKVWPDFPKMSAHLRAGGMERDMFVRKDERGGLDRDRGRLDRDARPLGQGSRNGRLGDGRDSIAHGVGIAVFLPTSTNIIARSSPSSRRVWDAKSRWSTIRTLQYDDLLLTGPEPYDNDRQPKGSGKEAGRGRRPVAIGDCQEIGSALD